MLVLRGSDFQDYIIYLWEHLYRFDVSIWNLTADQIIMIIIHVHDNVYIKNDYIQLIEKNICN